MIDKTDQRLHLTLRQLEVFVATARAGTVRAGAQRVSRSQSAASAAIAELESAIGSPLFDRVGRHLALNEDGRALLPGAVALLDQATELQGLLSGGHASPLRMAASLTIGEYLLPPIVGRWQAEHPASPVRLSVANTRGVIESVASLEVDVGFIEGPQTHPDLRLLPWLMDELVIAVAPGHPLAGHVATRGQLARARWILREMGSGTRQAADAWLGEQLGTVDVAFELGSSEAVKRLAATGAGLACLSRHAVAPALAEGWLVELRTRLPRARRRLAIVVRRDRRLGQAAREFIDYCLHG